MMERSLRVAMERGGLYMKKGAPQAPHS